MFDDVLDTDAAVARLLRFLAVDGITGQEEAIGAEVVRELVTAGVPRSRMHFDKAHELIPEPTQTGNLIVTLPGTRPGPRRVRLWDLHELQRQLDQLRTSTPPADVESFSPRHSGPPSSVHGVSRWVHASNSAEAARLVKLNGIKMNALDLR